MADQEPQEAKPQSSTSVQTPRPVSGTQPRLSYSLAELGTPSGEVVFNFGRQTQGDIVEGQEVLPLGGKSPRLSSAEEALGSRKSPWSHRIGVLKEMLASAGTLKENIITEMATLMGGSRRLATRYVGVGDGENQPIRGEKSSSPIMSRVAGHAGAEMPPLLPGEAEGSCGLARNPASGVGVSPELLIQQGLPNRGEDRQNYASVQKLSPLDIRMKSNESRQPSKGVGTGSQPFLYRTSGTNPEKDLTFDHRTSHKKPANYDGTSSFLDYLVQFDITSTLHGWDNKVKAMELATSLRGAAQSILSDLKPEHKSDYDQLVKGLTARFEPTNQTELYRAQIKGRLRKKSETVQELAQDINRLVRRAYLQASSELRDQIANDCFIDSLNEHQLEWFVYQGKPKSVNEATQLALEFEGFQAGRKRSTTVRQCSKGDNPVTDPLTQISTRLEKMEKEFASMRPYLLWLWETRPCTAKMSK